MVPLCATLTKLNNKLIDGRSKSVFGIMPTCLFIDVDDSKDTDCHVDNEARVHTFVRNDVHCESASTIS